MHSFYISAAHKSSGKTTISLALSSIFSEKYQVQTFKKGPDYIDPIWLNFASKSPCYNLDFYNMSDKEIKNLYYQNLKEINIVEGNKGLFDGVATSGEDSNAELSKLLNLPVLLVIDCIGITRGIAPLLQGYNNFDDTNIAGVILNKVGGNRHEKKLINAIQEYTDLEVFGSVHKHKDLIIDERHLGLKPATEDKLAEQSIDNITSIVKNSVDTNKILQHTKNASFTCCKKDKKNTSFTCTIAIAKDEAFGFYYADDLQKFKNLGVEIKFFNAFTNKKLPKCDGLFIGGGFPETNIQKLAQNTDLMTDIKEKIEQGLPTYAECGGMMYLSKSIDNHPTVGVIDADTITTQKPVGRGYMKIEAQNHPWNITGGFNTHEFHYSKLINLKEENFAFKVKRGYGITGDFDGIIKHNLLATYTHQRAVGGNNWVKNFIDFIEKSK